MSPIVTPLGRFTRYWDYRGIFPFKFEGHIPDSCPSFPLKYGEKLYLLAKLKYDPEKSWNEYIRRCFAKFSSNFQSQLQILMKKKNVPARFIPFLKRREHIQEKEKVLYDYFIESLNKKMSRVDLYKRQEVLNQYDPNHFLVLCLNLDTHLRLDNKRKITSTIFQLSTLTLFDFLFGDFQLFSHSMDHKEFQHYFNLFLRKMAQNLLDPTEKMIFLNGMARFHNTIELEKTVQDFDAQLTKERLMEAIKHPYWGVRLPQFWHSLAYYRFDRSFWRQYLKKALLHQKKWPAFLPFYDDFLVQQKKGLGPPVTLRDRYLFVKLLENNAFFNDWKKDHPLRPLFLERRSFFLDLIKTGISLDFSVLELYLLGDYNEEYLWILAIP